MGLQIAKADYYRDGYDVIVEGAVRVAVRYAAARVRRGKVYRRVDGSVSHHPYLRWTFNFHRHGKLDLEHPYCDFFVCMLSGTTPRDHGATELPVYVIPWGRVSALTFSSSLRQGSTRAYSGRYAPFRGAWHLIATAAGWHWQGTGCKVPEVGGSILIANAYAHRVLRGYVGDCVVNDQAVDGSRPHARTRGA
jgi:hypothetical protein